MNMKKCLKLVNKIMQKAGYSKHYKATEENLSETLKELLEQYPTMLENESPELYNKIRCVVDLEE